MPCVSFGSPDRRPGSASHKRQLGRIRGLSLAITVGVVDVLAVHACADDAHKIVSAGVDLAIGMVLLAFAAVVLAGLVPGRRNAPASAAPAKKSQKGSAWVERSLSEPRLLLASGSAH